MRRKLLQYHTDELAIRQEGLNSWRQAPNYDQKCKREHIATFKKLVEFHKQAIRYLKQN